jgi:hypothetical protein
MKFADSANRDEAKTRLETLGTQIPEIKTLHVGLDVVLTTTHESVADLKAYQANPDHVEFGGWLRPLLTSRVVVDYDN